MVGGCRLTGALVRRKMQPFLMSRRFYNTQTDKHTGTVRKEYFKLLETKHAYCFYIVSEDP